MKKFVIALIVMAFVGSVQSALIVQFNGNYDNDQSNNDPLTGIVGNTADAMTQYVGKAFSTTTAMTPEQTYTGPAIYGGYMISAPVGATCSWGRDRVTSDTWDTDKENLFLRTASDASPNGSDGTAAVLFPTAGTPTLSAFDEVWGYFNNPPDADGDIRYMLEAGDGTVYLSQESLGSAVSATNDVTGYSWATYAPGSFNGVDDIKMEYEDAVTSGYSTLDGSTTVSKFGFVKDFNAGVNQASFAMQAFEVIPEPATIGLLGIVGIGVAFLRRRRFRG